MDQWTIYRSARARITQLHREAEQAAGLPSRPGIRIRLARLLQALARRLDPSLSHLQNLSCSSLLTA